MLLQVYHHHMQSGKFAIFSKGAGDTRTEAEFISDTRPGPHQGIAYESDTNHAPSLEDLFAGPLADTSYNQYGNVIIMKDYFGAAFLPQYNFNGIGSICKYEGLQIKAWQPFQLRFHAKRNYRTVDGNIQYGSYFRVGTNWNMIGFGNKYEADCSEVLEPTLSILQICKDYLGAAYMPQWNFNGIGNMEPGQGFQVKLNPLEGGFYFFVSEEP